MDHVSPVEVQLLSVPVFCKAHGINRSTFYRMLQAGTGPLITKVNKRTFVSATAAAQWRRSLESDKPGLPRRVA